MVRKYANMFLLLIFFCSIIFSPYASAQSSNNAKKDKNYVEGEILVKFKPHITGDQEKSLLESFQAKAVKHIRQFDIARVKIATSVSVQEAVELLKRNPNVQYAEPNYYMYAVENSVEFQMTPVDPWYSGMYNLNNTGQTGGTPDADIDAPEAWDITNGDHGIVVAVIDSGLDWTHEDILGSGFPGNLWINHGEIVGNGIDDDANGYVDDIIGWDFVNDDNTPYDDNGHGTHVSGTIGAIGNNGTGVTGVMWNVQIMPLKFINADGYGTVFGAMEAIAYAVKNGAGILSNSWGSNTSSLFLQLAIDAAQKSGKLFIAAAGNGGSDGVGDDNDIIPFYPASFDFDNIISVAATDHNDAKAGFSNFGRLSVDVGAPGVGILSTVPGNKYAYYSGTSMATPHVAGVAGLIWSLHPELTYREVRALIRERVDWVRDLVGKTVSWGRLNAAKALATPPVETTLTCDPFVNIPDPLHFTANVTNNADTSQKFTYFIIHVLPDGAEEILVAKNVSDFPPMSEINVPISFPVTGWPPGKHSLKAVVGLPVAGFLVDSSICELQVQ